MTKENIEKYLSITDDNNINEHTLEQFFIANNIMYIKQFLKIELNTVLKHKEKQLESAKYQIEIVKEANERVAFTRLTKIKREELVKYVKENISVKENLHLDLNLLKTSVYNVNTLNPTKILNFQDNISVKFFEDRYYIFLVLNNETVFLNLTNVIQILFDTVDFKETVDKVLELTCNNDFVEKQILSMKKALVGARAEMDNCCKQLIKIFNSTSIISELENAYLNSFTTKQTTLAGESFFFYSVSDLAKKCNINTRRVQIIMFFLLATGWLVKVNEEDVSKGLINQLNRGNKFNNVSLYKINTNFNAEQANKAYQTFKDRNIKQSEISKDTIKNNYPEVYSLVY